MDKIPGVLTAATLYQKVAKRVSIKNATRVTDALDDICGSCSISYG